MLVVLIVLGLLVVGGGGYLLTSGGGDESGDATAGSTTTAGEGQGGPSDTTDGQGDGAGSASVAPAGGDSPEETVASYVGAAANADCQTMVTMVTENMLSGMSREMAVDECELLAEEDPTSLEVYTTLELHNPSEEGDTATVEGRGDYQGSMLLLTFTLVRDGDSWLIDDIG